MNWIEIFAVGFGFLSVWLTIRRNIWCWPTGLVQVLLYIYIFYDVRLYSDMILHVIYVGMQIYGWYFWLHGGQGNTERKITLLGPSRVIWGTAAVAGTVVWGFLMGRFTDASVPYADAFTTVVSLIAQWLLARKKLETWYFWIAVDVVAIGVYWYKELFLTAGLYTAFLVLAVLGLVEWRKAFHTANKPSLESLQV